MADPLVIVPSYGRAGKVSTVRMFPFGIIVVPERQEDSYLALQELPEGWTVETIPDGQDGNISRKRNAILRKYPDRDLVMLDDDYSYIGRWEGGEDRHLDADGVRHLLAEGFRLTREIGTCLWGVNVQVDRRFYREMAPFSMLSVALGPFQAWTAERPLDLRYDEDLWLTEDYDMSLQVLRRFHCIFRFSAYHYLVDHQSDLGGVVGQRNMAEEVRQKTRLQAKWGSDVVRLQFHRSINPIIRVPLKGI